MKDSKGDRELGDRVMLVVVESMSVCSKLIQVRHVYVKKMAETTRELEIGMVEVAATESLISGVGQDERGLSTDGNKNRVGGG